MTGILGGIAITSAQLRHILLRTQYAGDYHLMQRYTLDIKTIVECLSDILQKNSCTRHQIRDAGIQRVDVIIWIGSDIHQFALTGLGILTVSDRCDSPLLRCHQLDSIGIGKGNGVVGHGTDAVRTTVMIQRRRYDGFGYFLEDDAWFGYRRPYPPNDGEQ